MAQNHILLLGAHGKIAKKMISKFLGNSWSVTALIRNGTEDQKKKQKEELEAIGEKVSMTNDAVTLDVLYHNLFEVKTSKDAAEVIKRASAAKPVNWIVWSAGSGGNKGPKGEDPDVMTNAIDKDAAIAFAHAATHNKQIERYLTISAINARRNMKPSWWDDEDATKMQEASKMIPVYTQAKLEADECLTVWGDERQTRDPQFKYVVLRPGRLVNDDDKEVKPQEIQLGQTRGGAKILREDVARTAVELLKKDASGWFDLLEATNKSTEKNGGNTIEGEVARAISDKVTSLEGEPEEARKKTAQEALDKMAKLN